MTPDIKAVEKVPAGVFITFEDGRSAIYSTALLYELLPKDKPVATMTSGRRNNAQYCVGQLCRILEYARLR